MKLIKSFTTLTLILFTLTLKGQVVACPHELSFTKDTLVFTYELVSSSTTPWVTILNRDPLKDAKESFTYDKWIPYPTNVNPVEELLTTFLGIQYRDNKASGELQMQSLYCVHVKTKVTKAPKTKNEQTTGKQ